MTNVSELPSVVIVVSGCVRESITRVRSPIVVLVDVASITWNS